jgi:hypothetical protein
MKLSRISMVFVAMLTCSSALAANYEAACNVPACLPFNTSNSYVVQFAVTTAQNNGAVVGDSIAIERATATCEVRVIEWEVIDAPVLNSSDLEWVETECLNP